MSRHSRPSFAKLDKAALVVKIEKSFQRIPLRNETDYLLLADVPETGVLFLFLMNPVRHLLSALVAIQPITSSNPSLSVTVFDGRGENKNRLLVQVSGEMFTLIGDGEWVRAAIVDAYKTLEIPL
jgi:hypothetical protein